MSKECELALLPKPVPSRRRSLTYRDLVGRSVDVVLAGGSPEALAAKAATANIPIVFIGNSDPVAIGLVASLSRPGANITGITQISHSIGTKRFEFLRLALPVSVVALLVNPKNPGAQVEITNADVAGRAMAIRPIIVHASGEGDLEEAFTAAIKERAEALVVESDPIFNRLRGPLTALAARYRLPAIYPLREHTLAGGLMSYGADFVDTFRQAGIYVARILKGEKPAELPVMQSARFELLLNQKTATALGLKFPPTLLALADDVIE